MCEIYGFSGCRKRELNTDLREFYSHAEEHPNGWGLALLDPDNIRLCREAVRADQSDTLKGLLHQPIVAKHALAHIRLATIGHVEYENCHPFFGTDHSGRRWTLIHNGTVFENDRLNKYIYVQKGETDSERILLYLLDCVNELTEKLGRPLNAQERFSILDRFVSGSSPKNSVQALRLSQVTAQNGSRSASMSLLPTVLAALISFMLYSGLWMRLMKSSTPSALEKRAVPLVGSVWFGPAM